jgi:hypothetical protein
LGITNFSEEIEVGNLCRGQQLGQLDVQGRDNSWGNWIYRGGIIVGATGCTGEG